MAKNTFKKFDEYKNQAVALKRIGAIDFIPRREKITSAQKSIISREWAKYSEDMKHALKKPEDFAFRKVSKEQAEILKRSGFKVVKGVASIPLADGKDKKYDKVMIGKGTITFSRAGKKNKMYLSGDGERLMRKAVELNSKRGRNQVVSFSIKGFAVSSQDFISIEEMQYYLQTVILPKIVMSAKIKARRDGAKFSKKEATEEFWSSVSIVTIGDTIAK